MELPSIDVTAPSVATGAPGLDPWPFVVLAGGLGVVLVIGGVVASVLNDQFSTTLGTLSASDPGISGLQSNIDITTAFEWVGYLGAGLGIAVAGIIAIVVVTTANTAASLDAPGLDCARGERREPQSRIACGPWLAEGGGLSCTGAL